MENLNTPITRKAAELATKNSQHTSPGPDGVMGVLHTCEEKIIPTALHYSKKTEKEGTFVNSGHEASTTLKPKPETVINKRTPG